MKKFFNTDNLLIAFEIIVVIMLVVAIIMAITGNCSSTMNATEWVANPANPASPVHMILK
jgi:hypothetical protein